MNDARAAIERVGHDLGQDGLFERPGVGVPEIFEQVLKIDARFPHEGILSAPAGDRRCGARSEAKRVLRPIDEAHVVQT